MSLEFWFQEVLDELRALDALVEPYRAPESTAVLQQLSTELEIIRDTVTEQPHEWGIKEHAPFCTAFSEGEYQTDEQGAYTVYARVTSTWTIVRVKPPGKKSALADKFRLAGNASTLVRLMQAPTATTATTELAVWREDVGAIDSPGCHFHVQIYRDADEPPNPKGLDVPRLPALLVTPAAVIDYVLGELFQKEWRDRVADRTADRERIRPIQQRRLAALLSWKLSKIVESTGSPWSTLKQSKPDADLFVLKKLPRLIPG